MFPHIIPRAMSRRAIAPLGHISRAGQVFKIARPADVSLIEEVHDGGYVPGNADDTVMVQAEVVAADCREVIGLTWVCLGEVSRQSNAFSLYFVDMMVDDCLFEVLVD